ncbi:MAG: T9SS type A sorting domain-containing protein [Saprospiraceae bacterium]|nr:T9SS type A sorting domain-containing protein [Saprospiraceae bacterium]
MRYLFILVIVFALIFHSECVYSQVFNRIYEEVSQSSIDYLTEDDLYYYSIDYAENIGAPELGFAIRTYDKNTGDLIRILYHAIPDSWLLQGDCKKVVHIGDKMYFVYLVLDTIYIYSYNKISYELEVVDSITHPSRPVYTWDIQKINNKILISYEYLDERDSLYAKIFETDLMFDKKSIDIKANDEIIWAGGLIRQISSSKILATAKWSNGEAGNLKYKVGLFLLDSSYRITSEWWTPIQDNAFNISDVIILSEDEILAMLQIRTYDYIFESGAFPHFVYRINLKDRKILWKRNFTSPDSRYTTHLGAMAQGHHDDTYFMASSTYAKDIKKLDSIVTVGRVVKFKGDGNVIWQRDYLHIKEGDFLRNNFHNIITATDGHYLLGGSTVHNGAYKSWLVKINEDGHILGDTTSFVQWEKEDWKSLITIYPNPVSDVLYINQEDVRDVEYYLTDMTGKEVARYTGQGAFQSTVWDISHLAGGSYILGIKKEGVLMGSKMIVKIR